MADDGNEEIPDIGFGTLQPDTHSFEDTMQRQGKHQHKRTSIEF